MKITELDLAGVDVIKSLWQELNSYHASKSTHFKAHFESFTFDRRVGQLHEKTKCKIFVATESADSRSLKSSVPSPSSPLLGYCIASVEGNKGKIDSIYVPEEFRNSGVGESLMEDSLAWLTGQGCKNTKVFVAEGNEQALPFYNRFGFKERFTVLQVNNTTGGKS